MRAHLKLEVEVLEEPLGLGVRGAVIDHNDLDVLVVAVFDRGDGLGEQRGKGDKGEEGWGKGGVVRQTREGTAAISNESHSMGKSLEPKKSIGGGCCCCWWPQLPGGGAPGWSQQQGAKKRLSPAEGARGC